jgi:hypothetical protein
MNTHSDGLYGTLSTLYKRKTLVRLESATPAVDHPVAKVELRQVREKMLCLSLRSTWSTAATYFLFYYIKQQQRIYNKRGKEHGILQYIQWLLGTKFPAD